MAELLLELLSEEIPARMQARAAEDLKRLVTEKLTAAGLAFDEARAYATPRRLALVVEGLPEKQPDLTEEKKGPKVGAPEQAVQGFMKANGLTSIDQAEVRETPKGDFYFAIRGAKGEATKRVLPKVVHDAIHALAWPKSMKWTRSSFRWVRPLHSVVAVFHGQALEDGLPIGASIRDHSGREIDGNEIELDEIGTTGPRTIPYGHETRGHRFLAPKHFGVSSFADYEKKLRKAKVILDPAERKAIIAEQAAKLAKQAKLTVKEDPALLDEVAGLVEWPEVLVGRIDDAFMDLPPEVLTTAMRYHQKYFSTLDKKGGLADRFLVVANMAAPEGSALRDTIVAGNERVLRARLADARFFWDQDRKQALAERVPALSEIVFHAKLGTLAEKVSRMQSLAVEIAEHLPGAERDRVRSAARLAKADLVTGMVGEFPELQGIMGRYYAGHDGEHAEVAEAIAEHYSPLGPNDRCPDAPVSVAVALADKIDTLVGMFLIGETPTGSKDPFALRRAALGVIRLITENSLRLNLRPIFETAKKAIDASINATAIRSAGPGFHAHATMTVHESVPGWDEPIEPAILQLLAFFADRLKVALRDKGVRHDLIAAVFALGGEDDLVRLLDRVAALEDFLGSDDGANLLVAYRRAANIVRIESKKDKRAYEGAADAGRFREDEETALFGALDASAEAAGKALAKEDFTGAMSAMAGLRQPVDAFFDRVTVNAEDPALRENRLNLLARIGATLGNVADFSKIEG